MDKDDGKEGSQTCHLCGKVQCGQRLGRVKCCRCGRIFCLQQLNRKFQIIVSANDEHFVCPRCEGKCCCVCNCQKPPPHVHCKVYKVRQNKMNKTAVEPPMPEQHAFINDIQMVPQPEDTAYSQRFSHDLNMGFGRLDTFSRTYSESQNLWMSSYQTEIPGIQNGDGLTQLNLNMLDNCEYDDPYNSEERSEHSTRKFSDNLHEYFANYNNMDETKRKTTENFLLSEASTLQLKATKTDVLFRMLDSFNQDSVHVTVTWNLTNIAYLNATKKCTLPALYTIVKFYPTILFTLENNSDFQEDSNQSQISITFTNTGAVRDTKSLCTCIALLDNSFRRFANVTVKEDWNHCSGDKNEMSFKKIGNADQKKLKEMIVFAEEKQKVMESSQNHTFVSVSYGRSKEEIYFENLPLISLILKRVFNEYNEKIVFSLLKMQCNETRVECVLEFSNDDDWVGIIKKYESSIEVHDAKEDVSGTTPERVLLDILN